MRTLSYQFLRSCFLQSFAKNLSKERAVSSSLLEDIQSHMRVSLNAGRVLATLCSSGIPPLALSKNVWHDCSNSITIFGVSSPSVTVGG